MIHGAAAAAKARIGEEVRAPATASHAPEPFEGDAFSAAAFSQEPFSTHEPRPAVDFSMDEAGAFDAPPEPGSSVPDQAIAFDDFGGVVDDDGIPVWEDPP